MAESKKSRKHGRNLKRCERYRTQHRRLKNKARRLLKHTKMHSADTSALEAIEAIRREYPSFVRKPAKQAA